MIKQSFSFIRGTFITTLENYKTLKYFCNTKIRKSQKNKLDNTAMGHSLDYHFQAPTFFIFLSCLYLLSFYGYRWFHRRQPRAMTATSFGPTPPGRRLSYSCVGEFSSH